MIHAFALEPKVVASWGRSAEFRFVADKFGFGTPRALLELPGFNNWKRAVYKAATELELSQEDMLRLAELFRLFGEHKCRRVGAVYDGVLTWLQNAEREHDRRPFAAVIATENPRGHQAVLLGAQLDPRDARWNCTTGSVPPRTPEALAAALTAMLSNCRVLHLVDPHFGPENPRHRRVLEALLDVLAMHGIAPELVRVHCAAKSTLAFFESEAAKMAARLPSGLTVEFARLKQRARGEKLHNRYVLTDLGGVSFGVGLDAGEDGETEDLLLLPSAVYSLRWKQYVENRGVFDPVDIPGPVRGTRVPRAR